LDTAAAALIAGSALWSAVAHPADLRYSLIIAMLGMALTLLVPGAWSVDARLFGWKRL